MDYDRRHHESHDHTALLRLVVDWLQHVSRQNERIIEMSDTTNARLDALEAVTVQVGDAITAEIQQLVDAKPGMTAAQIARVDGVISRLSAMVTALKADDATPPATVDPAALAAAIASAANAGVTAAQLSAVTTLGVGVSPTITKAQLADALVIVQAPPSDGSAAVTAAQVADLIALTV